jgi:hypothetical protein
VVCKMGGLRDRDGIRDGMGRESPRRGCGVGEVDRGDREAQERVGTVSNRTMLATGRGEIECPSGSMLFGGRIVRSGLCG